MSKLKVRHIILIAIGLVLLTLAIYEPAYAWVETTVTDALTPQAVVVSDLSKPRLYQFSYCYDGISNGVAINSEASATPTPIMSSKAGALYIIASDTPKEGSGIDTVTATATAGTPPTLTFARSTDFSLPPAAPDECDYSLWKAAYTTPTTGTAITFVLTIKDKAGNTFTRTRYATTAAAQGDFYLNDQKVTVEMTIYINTLTLNCKFKATALGYDIKRVYWQIYDKTGTTLYYDKELTETVADTEWTDSFTLPAQGTYKVYGYYGATGGEFQKMFIGVNTGSEPVPPQNYYRLMLGLLGCVFVGYSGYDIYAEEKPKIKS